MIVDEVARTGWPRNLDTVAHRIRELTRDGSDFKIGITGDPHQRARGYRRKAPQYKRMVVLYETTSEKHARDTEERLIKRYRGRSDNWQEGGGPLKGPPYFLYVVIARPIVKIVESIGAHRPPDMGSIRRVIGQVTINMASYRVEIRKNVTRKLQERGRHGYNTMTVLCTTSSWKEALEVAESVAKMHPYWHREKQPLRPIPGTGPYQVCVLVNKTRPQLL